MITWLLTLFLVTATNAHAKGACEFFIGKSPLAETALHLKKLGFHNLLEEFDQGKIEVSHRWRLTSKQPAVSARVNMMGKKILVVRNTEFKTEIAKQKFVWEFALALFHLKMRGKFAKEIHDIEDPSLLEFAIGFRLPRAWRDDKVEKAEETLKELYYLFMLLDQLDAEVILPQSRRGAFPNQEDFARLVNEGEASFGQHVTQKHKRSFLFAYYMNHMRRMLGFSTVIGTSVALAPIVQELPYLIEASDSFRDFLINLQIELYFHLLP